MNLFENICRICQDLDWRNAIKVLGQGWVGSTVISGGFVSGFGFTMELLKRGISSFAGTCCSRRGLQVFEGTLYIDLEGRAVELECGQIFTVPANVRDWTLPKGGRSVNLTFER